MAHPQRQKWSDLLALNCELFAIIDEWGTHFYFLQRFDGGFPRVAVFVADALSRML
jgi:hypothetical protein